MKKFLANIKYSARELFLVLILLLIITISIFLSTYFYFAKDLKDKNTIINNNDTGVVLLDRNDRPFFTFYQTKFKKFIPLSRIPKTLQQAIISSEDKNFYHHSGFSAIAIIRAIFLNLTSRNQLFGGSTITQQLVKNSLLTSKKELIRKIQEVILAQEIERKYNKNEILEMYINSVYFGEGAFGIENAARYYFAKKPEDLNLNEVAFLAASLPSPSLFSPKNGDIKQINSRKNIVLKKMYGQGYISTIQLKQFTNMPLEFHAPVPDINIIAPHFSLMIRDELVAKYGEEFISRSGLRVKTTLNLDWQKKAEKAVADQVKNLSGDNVSNGAAVILDPQNGEILAMVGSANWYDNKFGKMNLAVAPRSMGSSFKPIIYSAALEKHLITPLTILHDVPTTFDGGYSPLDYDRKFRGNVTVRRALANSLNIPAVEVMQKVGLPEALEISRRLGISSLTDPSNYGLSLVLGAGEVSLLEMTGVYSVFASQGIFNKPAGILEIYDKQGKQIYSLSLKPKRVLAPTVTSEITSILSDNKARAEEFGNLLTTSVPAAVKTGTAEDWRDSLTFGYTPEITIGVWIGNNDNSPMDGVAGSLGAAPIWKNLITQFSAK